MMVMRGIAVRSSRGTSRIVRNLPIAYRPVSSSGTPGNLPKGRRRLITDVEHYDSLPDSSDSAPSPCPQAVGPSSVADRRDHPASSNLAPIVVRRPNLTPQDHAKSMS